MKIIYAIPGLATTKELFKFTKIPNAKLNVLDWPKISKGETMQTYAAKFLDQIDTTQPFHLLGVSFGGMLCSEISLLVKPEKTFLISSCKCSKELPVSLKLMRKMPIYQIMSEKMLKDMAANSRLILGFDKSYMPEFLEMVNSMQPNYFKRSINCIVNWKNNNCKRDDIIHIHGNADNLLFYKSVKADYTIKNGTHAMIVNKAQEINELLNTLI